MVWYHTYLSFYMLWLNFEHLYTFAKSRALFHSLERNAIRTYSASGLPLTLQPQLSRPERRCVNTGNETAKLVHL